MVNNTELSPKIRFLNFDQEMLPYTFSVAGEVEIQRENFYKWVNQEETDSKIVCYVKSESLPPYLKYPNLPKDATINGKCLNRIKEIDGEGLINAWEIFKECFAINENDYFTAIKVVNYYLSNKVQKEHLRILYKACAVLKNNSQIDLNKLCEINKESDKCLAKCAYVCRKLRKIDEVFFYAQQALDLNPHNIDALKSRAWFYGFKEEYDFFLDDLNRLLEINPNDEEILRARGRIVYRAKGEFDLALADFNKSLEINPDSINTLKERGMVYALKGELELALHDINELIERDFDNPSYLDLRRSILNALKAKKEMIDKYADVINGYFPIAPSELGHKRQFQPSRLFSDRSPSKRRLL